MRVGFSESTGYAQRGWMLSRNLSGFSFVQRLFLSGVTFGMQQLVLHRHGFDVVSAPLAIEQAKLNHDIPISWSHPRMFADWRA